MGFSQHFKLIIFDLDDTLINTSRFLVPLARQEAVATMVKMGLTISVSEAMTLWARHDRENPRADFLRFLTEHFCTKDTKEEILHKGRSIFLKREVPEPLDPIAGVPEMLTKLRLKYQLALVTQGDVLTQRKKVYASGLFSYFHEVRFVNSFAGENKESSFLDLQSLFQFTASEVLVVGNRIDSEIFAAKKIGMKCAWVKQGEHRYDVPATALESPDYMVDNIRHLEKVCEL